MILGWRRRRRVDTVEPGSYVQIMSSVIDAPVEWIEAVGDLRFPSKADHYLQTLMDRNNEGLLTDAEREELEALVELSERLSLVRAQALQMLGKRSE